MLNTAAKLQSFLRRTVDALPDLVQKEIDPQQYSRTLLVASQCVSEHWKDLAQYLGVNPYEHWDVLEESSDADEKCHGVSVLPVSKHILLHAHIFTEERDYTWQEGNVPCPFFPP